MGIFTLIGFTFLLLSLWDSGIIPLFIFVCICVFIWEKFKIVILLLGLSVIFYLWIIYNKNKNINIAPKTPEELERLKNLEKVREWSRRNKC